jgi:putative ABC transport system permease protein
MAASTFVRDSRYAVRMLAKHPGFTAIAVLTFALGIGANTAVFSVFNGVLLRPLPYPDPDRITMIWMDNRRQNIREDITSYPTFRDWREQSTSFAHMAALRPTAFSLTGAGEPERLQGAMVTAGFFDVMGLSPVLGRGFDASREAPGRDGVVVLAHGLWQRQFGGAGDVLGRTITLDGRPHEIIGVMPPELEVPEKAELWKPLAPEDELRESRSSFWLPVIGRLKPGISLEQAQAEMSGIAARLEQTYESNRGFGAYVVPLHRQLVGDIAGSLRVLQAAVGFVLQIACANLGNLMLARTAARGKELAIRTALGAGRARLMRQLVTETFMLALAGGALGVLLAYWAAQFFVQLGGDTIPRPDAIGIDVRVLAFTLLLAVLAALVAGFIPAVQSSRAPVADHLREGGREGGAVASRRTRSALVAAEVALAFVLLAGAGVLIRSLWTMQRVDRGFLPDRIATMTISLPATMYSGPAEVRAFYDQLLDRLRALPGVESAAAGSGILQPLVTSSAVFEIEGRPLPPPEEQVEYPLEVVSPGYFETLGMALASGRTFSSRDHGDAPRAIVINETLARHGWPGQDPLGRRLRFAGDGENWMTVVGVIRDVRRADLMRGVRPELYLSALQFPRRTQMLIVRTAGEPGAAIPMIRREVRALNPQLPLFATGTLSASLARTLTPPRFRAILLAAFAAIALLLAGLGIYGVTAHAVSQRTHEVGVRMALGARRADVLKLMIAQHLMPAFAGVIVGLAAAVVMSRWLRSFVYGVGVTDPATFVLMGAALLAVAAAACWIPARRAMRVDPVIALRT